MALQVIGAGLGRTGTLSLKTALEMLGFGPCHHMMEVFADADRQIPLWNRVADGEAVDWEEIFGDFLAAVDWPSCHYYAELAERYPEAKVVLSLRDPESWYKSMTETLIPTMAKLREASPNASENPYRFTDTIVAKGTFDHDFSKENAIAAFERHNAEVQRRIPPERLLVFRAADGWEPLCDFLGVPVPAEPFPRVNDRAQFQERNRELGKDVLGEE